ncbi:MAG: fused MFS/spermidine synthase [Bacteroidetes bacterium]|nr:fused MFS/spermidine synthase [Bacteroidota bacterium]
MRKILLELTVFLCGAVVMIFEILGSRVLGPYLGTSMFVWTSLIGIILGSLSLGYWLGGMLSDRKPYFGALGLVILGAAIAISLTSWIGEGFLSSLSGILPGIRLPAVIASIVLFSPASIFLGMVTPYAVRLKIRNLQSSGRTVGNLYAISTVGSIAGTFLAGFFLIPAFGTTKILFALSILLVLISGMILFTGLTRKKVLFWLLIPASFPFLICLSGRSGKDVLADVDTKYNRVRILDIPDPFSGKPSRIMMINDELSSAMFMDSDSLVFPYTRYYKLAEHFVPDFRHSLMLGGAGYSFPKYYIDHYTDASIDVVEIDPGVTRLAYEYFRLKDNSRLNIFHEDGRTFLNRSKQKYDAILGDAYKSMYSIPWQLTTLQSVQRQYDLLNDDGAIILNVISSLRGPGSLFLQAELKTYQQVFPQVYLFKAIEGYQEDQMQSIILIALKSKLQPTFRSDNAELDAYLKTLVSLQIEDGIPVLTDEYAPVDYFALQSLE